MRKTGIFFISTIIFFFITGCGNNNLQLLCKKWDCVRIENLAPINKSYQNTDDSLATLKIESALRSLNWTFSKNREYQCSLGSNITTTGTFQLLDKGSRLVCTSNSKNSVNTYSVTKLSEHELVLSSAVNNITLVLHFRAH